MVTHSLTSADRPTIDITATLVALPDVKNTVMQGPDGANNIGFSTYSGSSVTNTSSDFLGDWRAMDSWIRYDLYRVRNRSRQLQRGNPACINMGRVIRNNTVGSKGFHCKVVATTGGQFGDATTGELDVTANAMIADVMRKMGQPKNFETRKRLSRNDADRLIVTKLVFDGEVIIRKRPGFANEFGFAWQLIDPDYLDHNLNRVEPNGNITKMGVELDKDDKFVVAYWFLERRPNDYFYNYATIANQRYYRVEAKDIIHLFIQTDDSEQTRGWPWIFAGMLNLYRAEKFMEAALINAAIGASKPFFYTKEYPEGFDGDPKELDDAGYLIDKVSPGASVELPYGVKPETVDTRYPDDALQPFMEAVSLGMSQTFGISYATTTGDLSKANFVSSRLGQLEEREFYMSIQEFLIEKWKIPGFDEELFRAMLAKKITLPITKFDKFNQPSFTGRRWPFVQPVDEFKAMELALNNRVTSVSIEIEKQGGDPDEIFASISRDEKKMKELGFARLTNVPQTVEADAGGDPATGDETKKPAVPKPPKPKAD